MAIYKDVVVNIQKLSATTIAQNNGLCLLLTTESTNAYKEYANLQEVAVDFAITTAAYKMANSLFAQEPSPDLVAIVGIEQGESFDEILAGLDVVIQTNPTFMFLVSNVINEAEIVQLSTWATTNRKFYIAAIQTASIDTVQTPESDFVVYFVTDLKSEYPEAALVGACSTFVPGSATWMFKHLNGITPVEFDDQATMIELINQKKFMTYVQKYDMEMTTGGFVTSGEYMDIMLGIIWLQNRMEYRIQRLLYTTPKLVYDDGGIALIGAEVEATLREGVENNIIRKNEGNVGMFDVQLPSADSIPVSDIEARNLKNITWTATLAGAIHHVTINGVVQY